VFLGGLTISETEEPAERSGGFICPNVSCRKIFAKPLKASILQQGSVKSYDACPFCLTEISSNSALVTLSVPVKEKSSQQDNISTQVEAAGKSLQCKNHFGYLSERTIKGQIPDECLTCRDIVSCMLKKTLE
jgi:hypothetical protein